MVKQLDAIKSILHSLQCGHTSTNARAQRSIKVLIPGTIEQAYLQ
jgi:hypothetical protein